MERQLTREDIRNVEKHYGEDFFDCVPAITDKFFTTLCGYLIAKRPEFAPKVLEVLNDEHVCLDFDLLYLFMNKDEDLDFYWSCFCELVNLTEETKKSVFKTVNRVEKYQKTGEWESE